VRLTSPTALPTTTLLSDIKVSAASKNRLDRVGKIRVVGIGAVN
jgi:hypothetical protein